MCYNSQDRYASMQRSFTQIANDITKSTNSLTSSQTSEVSSDPGQPQTPGKMDDESSEINAVKEKEREKENSKLKIIIFSH